jgi:methionyl aminopeptidase
MAELKTPDEIRQMRAAGLLVWEAHQLAAPMVRPGVTTLEIDRTVEAFLQSRGAVSLFKGVQGQAPVPFPAATCISVNDAVVHGIPNDRPLREGDVVSLDIGAKYQGWCGDAAVTHAVGEISPRARQLLRITEGALRLAIELLGTKRKWSQVASEMARYVRKAGFSVVEELVGHSIGREMWEGLQLPNYSNRQFERDGDFLLRPGLVLAVEPMVNAGTRKVNVLADQWTIVTADGRPSAHFEHTIALTEEGPQVLTASPEGTGWAL